MRGQLWRERGEKRKKRRDREIEPRMREMKLRPGGGGEKRDKMADDINF